MPAVQDSHLAGVCTLLIVALASPLAAHAPEAAFFEENDAAMSKMHRDMHVAPTGDVDRDFVAMMIPHHQGAIEMAQAVLRHGQSEAIRRLAQEIIVEQRQEIAAMRLAVGQPLTAADTQPVPTAPLRADRGQR
jgi:hypothetical protein